MVSFVSASVAFWKFLRKTFFGIGIGIAIGIGKWRRFDTDPDSDADSMPTVSVEALVGRRTNAPERS